MPARSQARGRKPQPAAVRELARLRQENARLAAELAQAREVIDVQGTVSGLLRQRADKSTLPPSAK